MARYPIRIDISKPTRAAAPKPTPTPKPKPTPLPITQGMLNSAARMQGEEARESILMRRKPTTNVIRTTVNERPTPTKGKK